MSVKIKSISVDPKLVKAGPDDGLEEGEFIVYPSTFTKKPDAYGDIVAPGAFLESLKEWKESGNVMPGLYGHRMDDPDYFVAGASDYGEDHHGWWVKGTFDLENPKAKQTYRLVKGRRLNQLSFAYDELESGLVDLDDGTKANQLQKLKVYEFSFVPVGANQDTSVVAVKGLLDGIKAGRVLSVKNESALKEARDAIDAVLASVGSAGEDDPQEDEKSSEHDQGEASGSPATEPGASDEEAAEPKSSAPETSSPSGPSADDWAALITLYASAPLD